MSEIQFPKLFAVDVDKLEAVKTDEGHIWGWEKWLVNDVDLDIGCKMLIIYPGFRSSKHSHETKHEYFQVLSGELKLYIWSEPCQMDFEMELDEGSQYFIPAKTLHRFETGTKQFVLLLEVSTFENEKTHKLEPSQKLY